MRWAGLIVVITFLTSCDLFDSKTAPVCDPLGPHPSLKTIHGKDATSCLNPDGEIVVEVVGGGGPYRYTIDNERYQDTGQFTGLYAGDYKVKVLDANNCSGFQSVRVGAAGNVFYANSIVTPDNKCFSDNGTITILARNGVRPYQYQFEDEATGKDSTFWSLKDGFYKITVTDAEECKTFVGVRVAHGFTGVSYTKDIVPIINSKCATSGCHNGDTGFNINFTSYTNLKSYGSIIKSMVNLRRPHRSQSPLLDQEIQYISCWVEDGTPKN